ITLYDYVDEHGVNRFAEWVNGLEPEEKARLRSKLDTLKRVNDPIRDLPNILVGPIDEKFLEIRKLQAGASGSRTALRPLACRGPATQKKNLEVTLLVGAKEVGGRLPKGVVKLAEQRRRAILADPARRCPHEPIRLTSR